MAKYLKLIVILILFLIILLTAYFIHWRYFELVHLKCLNTEIISDDKKGVSSKYAKMPPEGINWDQSPIVLSS